MEYFTKEEPIILKEYGRYIQNFVEVCIAEPDRKKRTDIAYTIVDAMAQLTPQVKQTSDYRKKLWDHLFFISDYKLDVDAPYDIAERELIVPVPSKFDYPDNLNKTRHYGRYIVEFIDIAKDLDESKRQYVIGPLASFMKLVHKTWNNEIVNDSIVKNDLYNLSKGTLEMPDDEQIKQLMPTKKQNGNNNNNNKRKKNNNNKNQKYQNRRK